MIPLMFSQIALKGPLRGVVSDDMARLSSGGVAVGPWCPLQRHVWLWYSPWQGGYHFYCQKFVLVVNYP